MDCSSPQPPETSGAAVRPELTKEQQAAVFRAASRRVAAATRREPADSTRTLLGDAADTAVYGAFVSLKRGGRLRSCCGHIRIVGPALQGPGLGGGSGGHRRPPLPADHARRVGPTGHGRVDSLGAAAGGGPRRRPRRGGGDRQARRADRPRPRPRPAPAGRGGGPRLRRPDVSRTGLPQGRPADRRLEGGRHRVADLRGGGDSRPAGGGGGRRPPARGGRRLLSRRARARCSGRSTSCLPRTRRRPSRSGGRARWCRTPAGSTRAGWPRPCSAGWKSPRARSSFARNTALTAPAGRWPRTAAGCSPAASWPPIRSWPRGWRRASAGWSWTRRPIGRSTPSRCSCRCLARLAPKVRVVGITVGDASLPELLSFGIAMSVVLRDMPQAAVADYFQRHEPLCRRRPDPPPGPAGPGRHRHARPRERLRDGPPEPDQHVRHGPLRGGDGGAPVAGLPEALRSGGLCHQRRGRRRRPIGSSATRACCSDSAESALPLHVSTRERCRATCTRQVPRLRATCRQFVRTSRSKVRRRARPIDFLTAAGLRVRNLSRLRNLGSLK